MAEKTIELKDLIGTHILSGVETGEMEQERLFGYESCNYVKFTLDGITYMAVEDPDDGYRSYCSDLKILDEKSRYELPDILVDCVMCIHEDSDPWNHENDILVFKDAKNGKEILKIGTAHVNDYYPYCVLEYNPENIHYNDRKEVTSETT